IVLIIDYHEPVGLIEDQLRVLSSSDKQNKPVSSQQKRAGSKRVGLGSQILAELGAHQLRLLSTKRRFYALSGFKIEIVDFVTE
ncbi:MAG: bifunctional 3,4-dihydroxy-2-butanone-4-phosphate synthase/GTP cyclohydrolase II, partial [Gammaproteobacteria bacterium]